MMTGKTKQPRDIQNVVATMAIEGMDLSEKFIAELEAEDDDFRNRDPKNLDYRK